MSNCKECREEILNIIHADLGGMEATCETCFSQYKYNYIFQQFIPIKYYKFEHTFIFKSIYSIFIMLICITT